MATEEQLLNILEDTGSLLKKMQINMKKCPKARLTKGYLETRLNTVEDYWRTFKQAHQELVKITPREKRTIIEYFVGEHFYIYEDIYVLLQADIRDLLSTTSQLSSSSATTINDNSLVQLPKIQLKIFHGSYEEWNSFQDLFVTMVHNNSTLSDVQKLHYLKSSVTGEAELLLKNIQVTNNNYAQAWEVLKNRYGNKRLIINTVLKMLFNQRKMNAQTPSQLKTLLDITNECLQSLNNLNVNIESWDPLIIFLVVQKLDPDSHKEWEECAYKQNSEELPKWSELQKFIEGKYRTLELVNPCTTKERIIKERTHHVTAVQLPNSSSIKLCLMCKDPHTLCHCKEFTKLDTEKRIEYVKTNNLCFNCLSSGHSVVKCRVPVSCRLCQRRHHSLLHKETYYRKDNLSTTVNNANASCLDESKEVQANTTISSNVTTGQGIALLATALVRAQGEDGRTIFLRALIDQGSQASFISERATQQLKLKKQSVKGTIVGVGSTRTDIKHVVQLNISSRLDASVSMLIQPYVMCKRLTTKIPRQVVFDRNWRHLHGLELADPTYLEPGSIDLLLGVKEYTQIIQQEIVKGPLGTPCAHKTTLGWIIFGEIATNIQNSALLVMHHAIDFDDMLKSIWEVNHDTKRRFTRDEQRCEDIYKETHSRDDSGRYIVKLPFKTDDPKSPDTNTKAVAKDRLLKLERRFTRLPNLKEEYTRVMEEYLTLNHMEEVPEIEESDRSVYLPHHAVVREQKESTKTRVVFDASCKGNGSARSISLNDELLVGPVIQEDLRNIIMRWRMKKICFVADIEKMYRQIRVTKADTNYQRILWRTNPSDDIKSYRLLTVTFGTASAPYLAVKTLHQLAEDEVYTPETENTMINTNNNNNNIQTKGTEYLPEIHLPKRKYSNQAQITTSKKESLRDRTSTKDKPNMYSPSAPQVIKEDFYMDDVMTGADTVEKAITLGRELNDILSKGGFKLTKWASNNDEFIQSITPERRSVHAQLDLKMDGTIKALGIEWNFKEDVFTYKQNFPQNVNPVTKRTILSDIQKLFDPLGWIAPSIVIAKILIQRLWVAKNEWDDEVDNATYEGWQKLRSDFENIKHIEIDRWIQTTEACLYEIHGFSDASIHAYAAAVYIRAILPNGSIQTNLIASKTRVAPVRTISLPKLELSGALLLAKLLKQVGEAIREPTANMFAWTDSEIVIAWLAGTPNKWQPFVANRVVEITDIIPSDRWLHVSSSEIPSDIASRGMSLKELKTCQLWWKGPKWLAETEITLIKPNIIPTTLEMKKKEINTNATVHVEDEHQDLTKRFDSFDSLTELLKTIVYCQRFLSYFKSKDKHTGPSALTTQELELSLKTCIVAAQKLEFKNDIECLKRNGVVNKQSIIKSLNPYLDQNDILRVGGRLRHAALLDDKSKHPIILGNKTKLTALIIADAHMKTIHGGIQLMFTYIRSRYWIIRSKTLIKSHIHRCWLCARHNATPKPQFMGDLPKERINPSRPFLHSGVDFAGPLQILMSRSRGLRTTKAYISIFVCLSTKAIHLELVGDLSAEAFIGAYKRFVARRGKCAHIWSDQGRNFVGANKILLEAWKEASFELSSTAESLALEGTQWHFIPAYSPNFGGLWEAGVKSIKYHLKRILTSNLTFEEMSTVLCQIEACLNSRPITVIDDDADNVVPLTPGHFLIGEAPITVPEPNLQNVKMHLLSRWQHTQKLVGDFWSRWQTEYLSRLQQRPKWLKKIREFEKGVIVLIKSDGLPPGKWLMGRIVDKHPGEDNISRVYSVKSGDKIVRRSVTKLCAMPCDTDDS